MLTPFVNTRQRCAIQRNYLNQPNVTPLTYLTSVKTNVSTQDTCQFVN
jgi:hypothetical protein